MDGRRGPCARLRRTGSRRRDGDLRRGPHAPRQLRVRLHAAADARQPVRPVRALQPADGDPNTLTVVYDVLGLSVMAPGVPVPLYDTGDHSGNLNLPSSFGFYPDVPPGAPVLGAGEPGYLAMMQADWEPLSADPTPQTTPLPPPGTGPAG